MPAVSITLREIRLPGAERWIPPLLAFRTTTLSTTLLAISAGAVFFGALTYIGNAPNLMVRSIAAHRGIRMPGFFGYMGWACLLLLPCFALLSVIFFL